MYHCLCVCVCVRARVSACAIVCVEVRRLLAGVSSFYHVGSRVIAWVMSLDLMCLYPLSHLISLQIILNSK